MHKSMEKIKDMLCEELDEYAKKGELSAGALDTIHKITDTIKNLDKIEMLEDDGGYSERYYPYEMYFDGGNSYARRRDSRGRYTRDGGRGRDGRDSGASYARGRSYSRDEGKESMIKKLEDMIDMASTDKEREALNHCVDMLEKA